MARILLPAVDGSTQVEQTRINNTMTPINNTLVATAQNDGTTVLEGNDDAITQGYNIISGARNNAFSVSGSANSILLTTKGTYSRLTLKKYSLDYVFRFKASFNNTGSVIVNIDSLGSITLKNKGANLITGEIVANKYYSCIITSIAPNEAEILNPENVDTSTTIQRKLFSVNDARVDVNGNPDYISTNGTDEITVFADSTNPIISTAFDGTTSVITTSTTLSIPVDGTYTIINDLELLSIIPFDEGANSITESNLAPSAGTDGDLWIRTNPLKTYKRIGGVWTLYRFIVHSDFIRTGGVIASPIVSALNGKYESEWFAVTKGANFYDKNHNIGSLLVSTKTFWSGGATMLNAREVPNLIQVLRSGVVHAFNGSAKHIISKNTVRVGGARDILGTGSFVDNLGNGNLKVFCERSY